MVTVNRRAASGRLKRNQWTGIRTRSTMRSDQAWVAGHRAALRLTPLYAFTTAITLIALLVAALSAPFGIVMLVGVGGLLLSVPVALYSAIIAGRAAQSVGDDPEDRQRR
ncbi:SdpI family protein [Mycobacterium sp. E3247]|uniref:SdpI family protein n=1 Tax=Mycobacterium sp. E3247 TaxID=1856864 RepID=UPI00210143F3|nr:SdpI family protein [Mycobacterium sp. E3247]